MGKLRRRWAARTYAEVEPGAEEGRGNARAHDERDLGTRHGGAVKGGRRVDAQRARKLVHRRP